MSLKKISHACSLTSSLDIGTVTGLAWLETLALLIDLGVLNIVAISSEAGFVPVSLEAV